MVSMMLPSVLVEPLEELEFELPRSAIEDDVPDVVPEELEVLPVRALIKF
jgi:hypothetical protein